MRAKPFKRKIKKITLTLSEREGERLSCFAQDQGLSRPDALRRIMRERLRDYKSPHGPAVAKNQLELFDTIQVDIFNNTSKSSDLPDSQ